MRIVKIDERPTTTLPYLSAKRGGGTESLALPILMGTAEGLPHDIDALVITSDLQGVAPTHRAGGASELLGVALAEALDELCGESLPPWGRCGVLLAGDLYSAPAADRRGATGDVRAVWQAFGERAAWVAGVAGNHDLFGSDAQRRQLLQTPDLFLLDGACVELGQTRFGGVGGIISSWKRRHERGRRQANVFLARLQSVLDAQPDVLILHEGPPGRRRRQPGRRTLTQPLERAAPPLVVCGHSHWRHPLAEFAHGQVLNVDSRVVVLERARASSR